MRRDKTKVKIHSDDVDVEILSDGARSESATEAAGEEPLPEGVRPTYEMGERFLNADTRQEIHITHRFMTNMVLRNIETGKESFMILRHVRGLVEDGTLICLGKE